MHNLLDPHIKRQTGTYGDMGCFGFFLQNLGCFCDGGLIILKNKKMYDLLLKLRTHGGIKRNQHDLIGYNSRLDEIQAAILDIKLQHLDMLIDKRIKVADSYFKLIKNDKIRLPFVTRMSPYIQPFTIRVKKRNKLENHLEKMEFRMGYITLCQFINIKLMQLININLFYG